MNTMIAEGAMHTAVFLILILHLMLTLRRVSSTLARGNPMSTMFCTMAGSGAAVGRTAEDALLNTALTALVPVEQSVRMVMTCWMMPKLHLDSCGCDHRGSTALTMVACTARQ